MITVIDNRLCIGCGVCMELCPGDVIRMSEKTKKAFIKYPKDCWTCYNCELYCPVGAVVVDPFKKPRPMAWKVKRSQTWPKVSE